MAEHMKVVPQVWTLPATVQPFLKPKQVVEDSMTAYMAYFDTLGFEWIFNVTDYEKKKMWAVLKGDTKVDFPIPRHAIIRAQANPQRFPEIWAFESEISLDELKEYSEDSPQMLADAIRRCGQNVFKTPKTESVIV
jgi:hypothetical protein